MGNPFFNALGGGNGGINGGIMGMLRQLKSNPMQFLMQRKFNIPANIANDPNAIMQHLLSTGQISQEQVNAAYQSAMRFRNN